MGGGGEGSLKVYTCHKGIAVLGQFCAEVIKWISTFTQTKNAPEEDTKQVHKGAFCRHGKNLRKLGFDPCLSSPSVETVSMVLKLLSFKNQN